MLDQVRVFSRLILLLLVSGFLCVGRSFSAQHQPQKFIMVFQDFQHNSLALSHRQHDLMSYGKTGNVLDGL